MNQERELQQVLQKYVDEGQLAGAAAAVWRDGAIQAVCAGWRDIESYLPIERDTIFRIASMTKPITSVVALMLVDEGRIALNDPISEYAPEFAKMRVLTQPDGLLEETDGLRAPDYGGRPADASFRIDVRRLSSRPDWPRVPGSTRPRHR